MSWLYEKFFSTEEAGELQAKRAEMEWAMVVLEDAERPRFKEHILWLEQQANRPFPVGDHMEMVKIAVRSNTLREIREHLMSEVRRAAAIIAAERERNG